MITVIADDITGAAEIAGIAKSAGFNTKLLMVGEGVAPLEPAVSNREQGLVEGLEIQKDADVLVYATDTRQMNESDAVSEIEKLLSAFPLDGLLFKKIDSVLRGHVKAECDAVLRKTDYENVLLVPQNPSKGRVVRNGLYYINDVLLNETQFASDPEFPATTADVSRLGVPDAESEENIMEIVKSAKSNTLFAGGADLFKSVLKNKYEKTAKASKIDTDISVQRIYQPTTSPCSRLDTAGSIIRKPKTETFLMVCGSTQSKPVVQTPLCRRYDAIESNMPENVFLGKEDADAWISSLRDIFPKQGVVLTINYPSRGGKDFAVRLRKTMAKVVASLLASDYREEGLAECDFSSSHLKMIIEGGATALEILATLGWSSFDVVKEHFPGVVEIKNERASIILKPGSYPWKGLLDE